jgi:hypothetical protein
MSRHCVSGVTNHQAHSRPRRGPPIIRRMLGEQLRSGGVSKHAYLKTVRDERTRKGERLNAGLPPDTSRLTGKQLWERNGARI